MTNELCRAALEASNSVTNCMDACTIQVVVNQSLSDQICNWLVAFGTMLVAMIALFGDWLKSLCRGKADVKISTSNPHYMLVSEDGDSVITNSENFVGKVWLEVYNPSRRIAIRYAKVSLVAIYIRNKAGDKKCYRKHYETHPRALLWSGVSAKYNSIHVAPLTPEYVHLVSIRKPETTTLNQANTNSEDPPSQANMPIVIVECSQGRYPIKGVFQDVIVQLRVTATTLKTSVEYVKVAWSGRSISNLKNCGDQFLECEVLTPEKFSELLEEP